MSASHRATPPGSDAPPARPAATVVLLRDGARGPELLMLRRHAAVEFAGDAWVFPGGAVDAPDRTLPASCWEGIDPAALQARFAATPADVLGFHVAAARETFEEAGILLARRAAASRDTAPGDGPAAGQPVDEGLRARVARQGFHAWLADEGLVLELGRLAYLSRWVTPWRYRKRFDACFFAAPAPHGQVARHDRAETTDRRWVRPADALAAYRRGDWAMMFPTWRTLEQLADHATAAGVLEAARAQPSVPHIQPHAVPGPDGLRLVHPDDPDYPHELYREAAP